VVRTDEEYVSERSEDARGGDQDEVEAFQREPEAHHEQVEVVRHRKQPTHRLAPQPLSIVCFYFY
jgi:hypothetical protein